MSEIFYILSTIGEGLKSFKREKRERSHQEKSGELELGLASQNNLYYL
jgi:hypothetical protein